MNKLITIVYEVHSIGHREALLHSTSSKIASSDGDAIQQRDESLKALKLALEYWEHRQQRYTNRSPVWVQDARTIIAKATGVSK